MDKQGKYPVQFWITAQLKELKDKIKKSHVKIYEDGINYNLNKGDKDVQA